jgi:hypothetical protein
VNEKIIAVIGIVIAVLLAVFCTGCGTARGYSGDGGIAGGADYVRPESIDAANYAIDERIYYLERELASARELNNRLGERLEGARATVREINQSSQTIRELSGRSAASLQEIIGKMERLVLWIDWVTNRVQYLEAVLASQVQDTDMVGK